MTRDDGGQQRDGLLSRLRRRMGRDTEPRRAAAPQPGMFTARSVAIPPPPEPPEDRLFDPGGGRADDAAGVGPAPSDARDAAARLFGGEAAAEAAERPVDTPVAAPPPSPSPPQPATSVPDLAPPPEDGHAHPDDHDDTEPVAASEDADPTLADLAEVLHRYVIEDAADAAVTEDQLPTARLEPEPFLFPQTPPAPSSAAPADGSAAPAVAAAHDDGGDVADQASLDAAEYSVDAEDAEDAEDEPEDTVAEARPVVEPSSHGPSHILVHDERLDRRPGPIRMSPSEAVALAQDGPAALRRRTRRQDD